jgi:hypothetical protein
MTQQPISRRRFLKGLGVLIALPYFPSIAPRSASTSPDGVKPPARLMFMCVPLGFVPNQSLFHCPDFVKVGAKGWLPEVDGPLKDLPEVHASLQPYKEHLSFLKGMCNLRYRGDVHAADDVFLTCADTFADPAKMFTNTVSCDQVAALSTALGGDAVRYRSLALGVQSSFGSKTGGLSWVENGVPISPKNSPAPVFDLLFGRDNVPAATRLVRLQQKKSVLDVTIGQLRELNRNLNHNDRDKLDEIVTAVRGVEANIQRDKMWLNFDKPKAPFARPSQDIVSNSNSHARTMFDLVHAAFLTDSTRVVTYEMPPSFLEISPYDKHQLNHDLTPERAIDAPKVDRAMSDQLAGFIKKLCDSKETDGQSLMYHTQAAYGSAVWGPNHSLRDLPIMLIGHGGGRIKQGMSRSFPELTPMANLWLTMMTVAGVEVPGNCFADSTGLLTDVLERA